MRNNVYTKERVRAIVEETRLNAYPDSNRQLYELVQEARGILRYPISEDTNRAQVDILKMNLANHTFSYVAEHYRREIHCYHLMQEAHNLLQAKTVFDLSEVAYLIRDLGDYNSHNAKAYRTELDDLWIQVQKGKLHAQGIKPLKVPDIKMVAENLKLYRERSAEISGLHASLDKELRDLEKLTTQLFCPTSSG